MLRLTALMAFAFLSCAISAPRVAAQIGANGTVSSVPLTASATGSAAPTPASAGTASNGGPSRDDGKIRGVNIGGWLVLEPFIRPTLFAQFRRGADPNAYYLAQDEWTFCEQLGKPEAERQLFSHWNNWFIESDMAALAKSGLSHIRIPFGYWSILPIDGEPYVQGAKEFLLKAINWAKTYNLQVWVDLHGAPGSQNGWNHSGRQGVQNFMQNGNQERTIETLRALNKLLTQPGMEGVVTGLEVVNEPFGMSASELKAFYLKAYKMLREEEGSKLAISFSDSFRTAEFDGFMKDNQLVNTYSDQHTYHIFDLGSLSTPRADKINTITCGGDKQNVLRSVAKNGLTYTGEWSLADTDCAVWLNNVNVGTRWEGTLFGGQKFGTCTGDQGNDYTQFSPEYIQFLQTWGKAQMEAFEAGSGWFWWNFKTESSPQWNFLLAIEQGWLPSPVYQRENVCKI